MVVSYFFILHLQLLVCMNSRNVYSIDVTATHIPREYVQFYEEYPLELCHVPTALAKSLMTISPTSLTSSVADAKLGAAYKCNKVDGHHLQLDYQNKTLHMHLTDNQLAEVVASPRSSWDMYHLGTIFVENKPVLRTRLQNIEGVSLIAEERKTTVSVSENGEESYTLSVYYNIRLPDYPVVQEVVANIDCKTGKVLYGDCHSPLCRYLTLDPSGEAHSRRCQGSTYDFLLDNKYLSYNDKQYPILSQLVVSSGFDSTFSNLYIFLYDNKTGCIFAVQKAVSLNADPYRHTTDVVDVFTYSLTSSCGTTIHLDGAVECFKPRITPPQAGIVYHKGVTYSATVMPFGSTFRKPYMLGSVYYQGSVDLPLVIPMLSSSDGVNLISGDAASYVISDGSSLGNVGITVVYKLILPGATNIDQLHLEFMVSDGQVYLNVVNGDPDLPLDIPNKCSTSVQLGTDTQCVVQYICDKSSAGASNAVYLFSYDAKTRYLTGSLRLLEDSLSHSHSSHIIDVYDRPYRCAKNVDAHIQHGGEVTLINASAGHISSHMNRHNKRAIVLPTGIGLHRRKYITRVAINDITLVVPYLEAADGKSLVDASIQPTIDLRDHGLSRIVCVTYHLILPHNETAHSITVEFSYTLRPTGSQDVLGVSLINKYHRHKDNNEFCAIDASIWVDTPEFSRERRAVGVGEKGVYVLMTRIISKSHDSTTGTLYMFLYDTANSALFSSAFPVKIVDNIGNKSCRWIKNGKETRYEYELGGVLHANHEITF